MNHTKNILLKKLAQTLLSQSVSQSVLTTPKKSFLLSIIFIAILSLTLLTGCGGGGGGSPSTTSSTDTTTTESTVALSGSVSPPSGVSPSSLTIVSLGETSSVTSDGNFTSGVYKEGVAVVAAMPENKEFGLMNIVATSTSTSASTKQPKITSAYKTYSSSSSIELSARTTAVSMVFVTPYFATNDPVKAASLISIIENDTKVATLASTIENVFNESDPLSNSALQSALGEAIASVLNTIQSKTSATSKSPATKPSYSPNVIHLPKRSEDFDKKFTKAEDTYSIDTDYIRLNITESSGNYNIDVDSRELNAVDWIGEVAQLNQNQFTSLSDLQNKAANRFNTYNRDSTLGKDRASAKGLLRWIDVIGTALDKAFDALFGLFYSEGIKISSTVDGIYIVRSFSGGGWGADSDERSFLSNVSNGSSNDKRALALNIVSASIDGASVVVDLKGLVDTTCLTDVISTSVDSVVGQALTFTSVEDLIGFVPDVSYDILVGLSSCVTKNASKNLFKFIAKTIKVSAEEAGKWISQYKWVEIAATSGKIIERATKLYAYATPLESVFVVVGSPFAIIDTTDIEIPTLRWPLDGKQNDGIIETGFKFGDDWVCDLCSSCGGLPKKHIGVDLNTTDGFKAKVGDPVYASASGTAKIYDAGSGWAKGIVIDHDGKFTTTYLHIDPLISDGQSITKGQKIAKIAAISGYHLHYGVRTGAYSDISKRGALPQKNTEENDYCKSDPTFKENFVNPFTLTYEYITQSDIAPPPPTGVSASAGNGQVTISWTSVSDATSYNIYWSTTSGVTKTTGTKLTGATSPYTHTGRTNGTTYYYVVTAVNSYGESSESSQVSATPVSGTTAITDIDGNVYNTVTIGTQVWMKENLKVTKYRNGDAIPTTTASIPNDSSSKYQWAYDGNESNASTYGRLYTWYAATDSRGLCPTGWHLPTNAEWTTLTNYLGGESVAGGKLKEAGTSHWISPNTSADNSSGFTALPGGYRDYAGAFGSVGLYGYWWSATEFSTASAWYCALFFHRSSATRDYRSKSYGFSVRCVRD